MAKWMQKARERMKRKGTEGSFTRLAQRMGMSTGAAAKKILAAPEGRYTASTRKKANFARNAAKVLLLGAALLRLPAHGQAVIPTIPPISSLSATVNGSPGSTAYTYGVVEAFVGMSSRPTSPVYDYTTPYGHGYHIDVSNGPATLSSTNSITITAGPCRNPQDVVLFFRTAGGSSEGWLNRSVVACSSLGESFTDTGYSMTGTSASVPNGNQPNFFGNGIDVSCGPDPNGVQSNQQIGAFASCDSSFSNSLAVGYNAVSWGDNSVSIGASALLNNGANSDDVVVGALATTFANNATVVGEQGSAGNYSTAIGQAASCGGAGSICLGYQSEAAAGNTLSAGTGPYPINSVYFGSGSNPTASPGVVTIYGSAAAGTNTAGAGVTIQGGNSTGNNAGGTITLSVTPAGTSGSSPNPAVAGLTVAADAGVQIHTRLQLPVYTVATLPTGLAAGSSALVSDASTFTPGTCTGGGSDYMVAVYSGSAWSCH